MTKVLWAAFASETLVVEVYVVNTEDLTRAFLSTPEKNCFQLRFSLLYLRRYKSAIF